MSALQPLNSQADTCEAPKMRDGSAVRVSAAIDCSPVRAFLVLSAIYFIVVLSLSSLKLLWLDELITLQIARLGSPLAIWHALGRGVDPNPPVTHLLVHYCRIIFGDHEFAYRLPAMVGYWVGLLALFVYLRDRLTPTWAIVGTVLSMTMGAFDYSYESRSYGIFYGLAMLAFLGWCVSVDRSRTTRARGIALLGMTLALAAGISTNYFAVLAFLPICAGEITRIVLKAGSLYRERRSGAALIGILRSAIEYRIWIALVIAATPILAYRPMIAHSIAQFSPYAWNKVSIQQVSDSYTEMVEIVLYPLLGLFVVYASVRLIRWRLSPLCASCRAKIAPAWSAPLIAGPAPKLQVPAHELVAVGIFMAYPWLGFAIASIRGGMLSPRFVIPVCFGFAIAGTFALFQLLADLPMAGVATLCFLACWFICRESYVGYWYEEQKQCFYKIVDRLPEAEASVPSGSPIVIPDPLLALTFQHYVPAALASRVVFPVDFPAIRLYRHDDSPEENLWAGRSFLYSLPIIPFAEFENSASQYLMIASDGNWLLEDLRQHHYDPQRLSIDTRAEAIGGFTPLAHGTPVFYVGDARNIPEESNCIPVQLLPFRVAEELPNAGPFNPAGERQ